MRSETLLPKPVSLPPLKPPNEGIHEIRRAPGYRCPDQEGHGERSYHRRQSMTDEPPDGIERRSIESRMHREVTELRDYLAEVFRLRDRALDEYKIGMMRAMELAQTNLEERLDKLNELRGNVITREEFISEMKGLSQRLAPIEGFMAIAAGWPREFDDRGRRLEQLEAWRNKMFGIYLAIMLVAGAVGAAIERILFGSK
jgi:hypothetical protein